MVQKKYGTLYSGVLIIHRNRYSDPKATAQMNRGMGLPGHGGINFDRFVRACVVVKQMHDAFGRADTDRDGWIQISYEQFMQMVLSLP